MAQAQFLVSTEGTTVDAAMDKIFAACDSDDCVVRRINILRVDLLNRGGQPNFRIRARVSLLQ